MSNRRRRGANTSSNANQAKPKTSSKSRSRSRKSKKKQQRSFWGEVAIAEREEAHVKIAEEPAAVVRSLGSPPLSGHETVAEHYFDAVYERAVGLASALAAAADLLEHEFDPTGGLERE